MGGLISVSFPAFLFRSILCVLCAFARVSSSRFERSMDEDRNRASPKGIGRVMTCLRSWSAIILGRTRETKDVLYQRLSRKPQLLLKLLACRTLDEWERTCKPYTLKIA